MSNLVDFPQGQEPKSDPELETMLNEMNKSGQGPQLSEKDIIKCGTCGNTMLVSSSMLARISPFVSGTGKAEIAQIPGPFVCLQCGKAISEEIQTAVGDSDPTGSQSGLLSGK